MTIPSQHDVWAELNVQEDKKTKQTDYSPFVMLPEPTLQPQLWYNSVFCFNGHIFLFLWGDPQVKCQSGAWSWCSLTRWTRWTPGRGRWWTSPAGCPARWTGEVTVSGHALSAHVPTWQRGEHRAAAGRVRAPGRGRGGDAEDGLQPPRARGQEVSRQLVVL